MKKSERNVSKRSLSVKIAGISLSVMLGGISSYCTGLYDVAAKDDDVVTLRVCNWEEYIDEGGWDDDETIELPEGDIIGVNPLYKDFEQWYYDTYHRKVKVEYSCFGTNEELYNMLSLGNEYDIVCPSEYMIMKLMAENQLVPFSDAFFDESIDENYYIKGVSPFIRNTFETNEINGEAWSKYAAGYMWGVTGIVYNPQIVSREDASTWNILTNDKYFRRVTIKDNVRDAYFAAVGAIKEDLLTSDSFINDPDYSRRLVEEMNDLSPETLEKALEYLQKSRDNVYSFETDSGKADMMSGRVVAGYQWSGDAVYTMDQAEEDDFYLNFAVPKESTNLYFDGWVMLKKGIRDDAEKQQAAEAFINFISRPDNAVRNMYYIGYTSVISGGDDNTVFDYLDYNYGVDEDADLSEDEDLSEDVGLSEDVDPSETVDISETVENTGKVDTLETVEGIDADDELDAKNMMEYPLGYFFSGDADDPDYVLITDREQAERQLGAQYPSDDVMNRSAIMRYFDTEENAAVNRMWIEVRCYNIKNIPVYIWIVTALAVVAAIAVLIRGKIVERSMKKK